MSPFEHMQKVMQLGFETGRGNANAFNEIFGEEKEIEIKNCLTRNCGTCNRCKSDEDQAIEDWREERQ